MGWLSDIFLGAEEIARGERLDAQKAELDRAAWEAGKITAEEWDRRKLGDAPNAASTYPQQVDHAFDQGWLEGKESVKRTVAGVVGGTTGTVRDLIEGPVAGFFRGLPWWGWIALGIVALAWSGALPGVLSGLRASFVKP